MTNSPALAPARTTESSRRHTTPATEQSEPDIKALWAPLLQLLNGSPTGYTPSR